jgi:hypothetical protein
MPDTTKRFRATVQSGERGRVFIALPFNPSDAWGKKQRHHVAGMVNGMAIRASLGSDGNAHFLLLGAAWRRDCGIKPGDVVMVELWPEGPQQESLAADIKTALDAEPQAREFFESLATFYRNTYVKWIESAKKPETRAARIAEMIGLLKAGKKQR